MKKILLASALATMMGGAFAQVYVGGAFGMTQVALDCSGASTCDKSDTGFKFYGGYQFNPTWSVEVGYIDFGAAKYTYWDGVNVGGKFEVSALTLAAAARAPFSPVLTGVARLGLANAKTEWSESAMGLTISESETKAKAYFGLGLEYTFTKQLRGTLSADFTQGEIGGSTGSVRAFGAGLQYGF
ncbi:MAG: outer membrane beta-barrel protein [Aquabacterium sp.]|uniref:outer membrane beta-barrel protein n=1 Tax=Aquabacterium sp. TaxID=1872578 RepID=UPI0025BB0327|nr:outer membrane beta-barrel protein [Aquabacterium sp.]MBI5926577.1 outer membrane beta-barrel protein [Aquabacterium sp.]